MARILDEPGRRRAAVQWQPAPPAGAPAPPGGDGFQNAVDPYDYSADPILQQIRALGVQRMADAQAAAIRERATAEADWADTQASDTRDQTRMPRALIDSLSSHNLGYSSAGNTQQTDLARSLTEGAAAHQRAYQEQLSGIQGHLTDTERDVAAGNVSAEQDAAQRLQDRIGDTPVGYQGPGDAQQVAGPLAREVARRARGTLQHHRRRGRHQP